MTTPKKGFSERLADDLRARPLDPLVDDTPLGYQLWLGRAAFRQLRQQPGVDSGGTTRGETARAPKTAGSRHEQREPNTLFGELSPRVVVVGGFKAGKTALVNAMLGGSVRTDLDLAPLSLPTDPLPATAVLTRVVYGDEPRVLAHHIDGTVEPWDWEEFVTNAILEADKEANFRKFGHINEFEVQYPSALGAAGVTLIDTPGFGEDYPWDAITSDAFSRAEARVMVYRSDKFWGEHTRDSAQLRGVVFRVVNLFYDVKVNRELCLTTWRALVAPRLGDGVPFESPEALRALRIYFVDVRMAERAIKRRDAALLAQSGLPILMEDLFAYLTQTHGPPREAASANDEPGGGGGPTREEKHERNGEGSMTATTVDQNLINQRIDEASGAIREIAAVANKLGQLEIERGLEESIGNLRHNNLRVLAFGEFNAGKSTLLNGMLGELTHNVPGLGSGAPLPTDAMPATAVLTSIVYGEEPRVLAYHTDGTVEPWDWEEFVDNAILEAGETENFGKFGHIKEFEVEYPSKLCAQRVTLIDAPGLNEDRRRDEITLSAVRLSDAALAIYRNDKFGGQSEQKYTSEMADAGLVETFRIMNIMNDQPINERFCRFVWARLVAPRFGDRESPAPATTPEELRKYRIYFVDALKAERAVKQRNPNLKKESGLPELMDDLFAFLTEERLPIFLERYSKQATKLGNDLEAVIDRTAQGLRQSRADLLHAIERVEPKRQELRRKQAEIPLIVERFRLMAEKDAVASHQHLVAGLIDELPGVLEHAELVEQREGFSAVLGVVDKLRAKPMAERASKIISAHLQDRIVAWAKNADGGLQTALIGDPSHPGAVPRMMAEIDQRVTEIEADLAGIAADVQGTSVGREHATVKEVGKIRKGIGIAIAAITGDPGMAAAGWAGDFKGMAISFGMLVGANIFLGPLIFAGPLGWAVLAGIVLFNVKRAQKIIEQNVKATVVRIYIEGDSAQNVVGLRDLTVRERPAIEQGVDTYFHTIEEIVTKEVGSAIKAQADEFEHLLDLSTDDLGKRDVELRRLDDFRDSLRAACNRLRNIQTEASQY